MTIRPVLRLFVPATSGEGESYVRLGSPTSGTEPALGAPSSAPADDRAAILLSTAGHYRLEVAMASKATFGQRLVEDIAGDDTLVIDKGDYRLVADTGDVLLTSGDTIKVKSTGGDIEMRVEAGMYKKSDSGERTTAQNSYRTVVLGLEFGCVMGVYIRYAVGGSFSINPLGQFSFRLDRLGARGVEVSVRLIAFTTFSESGTLATLAAFKQTLIDGKRVVFYQKLTTLQFYKTTNSIKTTGLDYDKKALRSVTRNVAEMERRAMAAGFSTLWSQA